MAFPKFKVNRALKVYNKTRSVKATVKKLGYPCEVTLRRWIKADAQAGNGVRKRRFGLPQESAEFKLEVIQRCFEAGESVRALSDETGYSGSIIYQWHRKYRAHGIAGLMRKKTERRMAVKVKPPKPENQSKVEKFPIKADGHYTAKEMKELAEKFEALQMENDILKGTIEIIKKEGVVGKRDTLNNAEKTGLVDDLKTKYPFKKLLKGVSLKKSTYYACRQKGVKADKYSEVREMIRIIFKENFECYGYRRIKAEMRKRHIRLSEKVIRRLMKEEELRVRQKKNRKYSSYLGEISPAVPNLVKRNFHADKPNKLWLTDITEFGLPEFKIYMSAIVDCLAGEVVGCRISSSPNAKLANDTLDQAVRLHPGVEGTVIHSDRGAHYRWPGWIERVEKYRMVRSMSKKGCSPDNAACEGFFGRLKTECFYGRDFSGYTKSQFISYLYSYIKWYNEKRIKGSLGYRSPAQYRMDEFVAG